MTRWTAQLAAYLKLRLVAEFNQRLRFGERERSQLRAEPTYQNQSFHLASLVLFLPAVGRFQVLERQAELFWGIRSCGGGPRRRRRRPWGAQPPRTGGPARSAGPPPEAAAPAPPRRRPRPKKWKRRKITGGGGENLVKVTFFEVALSSILVEGGD